MALSSYRITTNGVFRNYRTNLSKNNKRLNDTMTDVQTQRKFNTYAEDPAAASKAFRLRRNYWLTNDQIDTNNFLISKYESAYSAMDAVVDGDAEHPGLDGILASIEGLNGAAGASRTALGRELVSTSESIVSMMNSKYADDFIFAGADGENLPFEWSTDGNGKPALTYRGIDVSTPRTDFKSADSDFPLKTLQGAELSKEDYRAATGKTLTDAEYVDYKSTYAKYNDAKTAYETEHPGYKFEDAVKLNDMANETMYVDIGLGMQEDDSGKIVRGSAFNSSVSGLSFLGYGEDKNLAVIVRELGEIFSAADPETGNYRTGKDEERASELLTKLHDAVRYSQGQHVQLSADAHYLRTNLEQLNTVKDELNTQIMDTESMDAAEAITEMSWAQYCYNAALRIGTNILSNSLIDYMS